MTKISDWDGCNDIFPECDEIYKLNIQFFENPFHGLTPTVPIVSLGTGKRKVELKIPSGFLTPISIKKNEQKEAKISSPNPKRKEEERVKSLEMETKEETSVENEKHQPGKRKRKRYDDSDSESAISDSE